jgi:hypothetical protein
MAGPHADSWMELHRWEPQVAGHAGTGQSWFSPEYCEFLTRFKGDVWMVDPLPPEIPNARLLPHMELSDTFGPFFFTSSLAWMLGMAIVTPGVEEIGLFGVDMAAHEEYQWQRPGCQFFLQEAMKRGIKVTVPPESDLLQPALWYGVSETTPMHIKLTARMRELQARKAGIERQLSVANQELHFVSGAIDDMNYFIQTWVTTNEFFRPRLMPTGNEVRGDGRI